MSHSRRSGFSLTLFLLLALSSVAHSHEVRPAYLEIVEHEPGVYSLTWKQPALAEARIAIDPQLPASCTARGDRRIEAGDGAFVARWQAQCPGALDGQTIRIAGLERTLTSTFVRTQLADGRTFSGVVQASDPSFQFAAARPVLPAYFVLGIEHILTGIDHVFFVIGLILLVPALGRLVGALTAFTVAHSITLGAAALGFAGLPQGAVEVVIALSILVVGYEVVRASRGKTGLTYAMPWAVAFGFGLLHGFGFAGALAAIGLPHEAKVGALLLFNLGVEAGQLMIVAIAVPIARWIASRAAPLRRRFEVGAGYSLGAAAAFWMIQRVATVL
ncbi:MAG TPA: HupE/UreJ family protein [Steroidobacteraceae bacterium]|nr:HupE/UreJ family protein [Steroidobacteraceae bacterium]